MTKVDLKLIIPNILNSVNFDKYLLSQGYSLIENTSDSTKRSYYKDNINFNEIVYLFNVNDQTQYYSANLSDSGNIIDFVKNRIEIDGTYVKFNPKKNNIIESCKKLLQFLNNTNENTEKEFLNTVDTHEFLAFQKKSFTHFHNAETIYNIDFLKNKGIHKNTINKPFFKNNIYNTVGIYHNNETYDVINTAFPLYNTNLKQVGLVNYNVLEFENSQQEDIIDFVNGSDINRGFWLSDIMSSNHEKVKITLVEDPIEALSHYQLYKENRTYLSFFNKSEKTLDIIYKLVSENQAYLYLSSDVSLDSMIFELRVIIYITSKTFPINFVIENNSTIEFTVQTTKDLKMFTDRIKRLNNKIISGVIKSLGSKSASYLANEIIKASKINDNTILVKIPKTLQILYEISKIIVNTYVTKTPLITEKSTGFSWSSLNTKSKENQTDVEQLIEANEIFGFKNINYEHRKK